MDPNGSGRPLVPSADFLNEWAPLINIDGCDSLRAHIALDVFGLWDAWEKVSGCECPIPFWSVAWPAAIVLARYLQANPETVRGKNILDLGCGGAIAAIAAARVGARQVVAADIDPIALQIARRNAEINGAVLIIEGRDLLAAESPRVDAEIILAADLFYERSSAASIESFLRKRASEGATVLIADGERAFAPRSGVTMLHQERIAVNLPLEGTAARTVRILRLGG